MKGGNNMMRIYRMPNGHMYQFEESEAPSCAVLVEQKAVEEFPNKAKKPVNKAKKAAVKK